MSTHDSLRLNSDRQLAMIVIGLGLVPALWYVRTDFALYGGAWPHLLPRLATRGLMITLSISAVVFLRRQHTREGYSRVVLAYALCIALLIVTINGLRPEGATLPLRTPLYHVFLMYSALPNSFWRQCLPPLALSVGLVFLRFVWLTSGAEGDVAGDVLILVILNVVGFLLVQRRLALEHDVADHWRAEHDALALAQRSLAELRTLRGIVPICSHCKKIRTAVGDWEQVEKYVRDHSHAEFSHGICPACIERHYELEVRSPTL